MFKKIIAFAISFCLIFEQSGFAQVAGGMHIPGYMASIMPPEIFNPVQLRAISFDPSAEKLSLFLDRGDTKPGRTADSVSPAAELYKYFEIGLRLPNNLFWVNLRPDSPQDIIDPYLEKTDVGRILLAADLQLKKDLALFTSPDRPEGKRYWNKLYAKAEELYGQADLEIPTMTRPWIVPGEIIIRESKDGAYIYKAVLKVMLEQDYLKDSPFFAAPDLKQKEMNAYSSELLREEILPKLAREVNSAKRYASLRQVYYSLVLAQWFKQKLAALPEAETTTLSLAKNIDSKDLTGLAAQAPWNKDTYYNAYKRSFSQGEYNKEEQVSTSLGLVIRSYFSGGIKMSGTFEFPVNAREILPPFLKAMDNYSVPLTKDVTVMEITESDYKQDGGQEIEQGSDLPSPNYKFPLFWRVEAAAERTIEKTISRIGLKDLNEPIVLPVQDNPEALKNLYSLLLERDKQIARRGMILMVAGMLGGAVIATVALTTVGVTVPVIGVLAAGFVSYAVINVLYVNAMKRRNDLAKTEMAWRLERQQAAQDKIAQEIKDAKSVADFVARLREAAQTNGFVQEIDGQKVTVLFLDLINEIKTEYPNASDSVLQDIIKSILEKVQQNLGFESNAKIDNLRSRVAKIAAEDSTITELLKSVLNKASESNMHVLLLLLARAVEVDVETAQNLDALRKSEICRYARKYLLDQGIMNEPQGAAIIDQIQQLFLALEKFKVSDDAMVDIVTSFVRLVQGNIYNPPERSLENICRDLIDSAKTNEEKVKYSAYNELLKVFHRSAYSELPFNRVMNYFAYAAISYNKSIPGKLKPNTNIEELQESPEYQAYQGFVDILKEYKPAAQMPEQDKIRASVLEIVGSMRQSLQDTDLMDAGFFGIFYAFQKIAAQTEAGNIKVSMSDFPRRLVLYTNFDERSARFGVALRVGVLRMFDTLVQQHHSPETLRATLEYMNAAFYAYRVKMYEEEYSELSENSGKDGGGWVTFQVEKLDKDIQQSDKENIGKIIADFLQIEPGSEQNIYIRTEQNLKVLQNLLDLLLKRDKQIDRRGMILMVAGMLGGAVIATVALTTIGVTVPVIGILAAGFAAYAGISTLYVTARKSHNDAAKTAVTAAIEKNSGFSAAEENPNAMKDAGETVDEIMARITGFALRSAEKEATDPFVSLKKEENRKKQINRSEISAILEAIRLLADANGKTIPDKEAMSIATILNRRDTGVLGSLTYENIRIVQIHIRLETLDTEWYKRDTLKERMNEIRRDQLQLINEIKTLDELYYLQSIRGGLIDHIAGFLDDRAWKLRAQQAKPSKVREYVNPVNSGKDGGKGLLILKPISFYIASSKLEPDVVVAGIRVKSAAFTFQQYDSPMYYEHSYDIRLIQSNETGAYYLVLKFNGHFDSGAYTILQVNLGTDQEKAKSVYESFESQEKVFALVDLIIQNGEEATWAARVKDAEDAVLLQLKKIGGDPGNAQETLAKEVSTNTRTEETREMAIGLLHQSDDVYSIYSYDAWEGSIPRTRKEKVPAEFSYYGEIGIDSNVYIKIVKSAKISFGDFLKILVQSGFKPIDRAEYMELGKEKGVRHNRLMIYPAFNKNGTVDWTRVFVETRRSNSDGHADFPVYEIKLPPSIHSNAKSMRISTIMPEHISSYLERVVRTSGDVTEGTDMVQKSPVKPEETITTEFRRLAEEKNLNNLRTESSLTGVLSVVADGLDVFADSATKQASEKDSGDVTSDEKSTHGGIDFRALPFVTQPGMNPGVMQPAIDLKALQVLAQQSKIQDLDKEWNQIQKQMSGKQMPYARMKEYVAVCCERKADSKYMKSVVVCVNNILKLEERCALQTAPELKELLAIIESSNLS